MFYFPINPAMTALSLLSLCKR